MLFAGICRVVFYICAWNHTINVLQWLWLLCRWLTPQNWWNLFFSWWAVVNTIGNDFGMVLVKVFMFFAEASRKLSGSKLFKRRHWKTPSPFVWKIGSWRMVPLTCAPDSPASTTKNIVPQCLAHQQIQSTHFHATPTKSFRGSSPCDRGSTSRKIVKKSTPRKLAETAVLNLLSRKQKCRSRKLRGRARGRVAIRPIKIWRNKNQNSNVGCISHTIFGAYRIPIFQRRTSIDNLPLFEGCNASNTWSPADLSQLYGGYGCEGGFRTFSEILKSISSKPKSVDFIYLFIYIYTLGTNARTGYEFNRADHCQDLLFCVLSIGWSKKFGDNKAMGYMGWVFYSSCTFNRQLFLPVFPTGWSAWIWILCIRNTHVAMGFGFKSCASFCDPMAHVNSWASAESGISNRKASLWAKIVKANTLPTETLLEDGLVEESAPKTKSSGHFMVYSAVLIFNEKLPGTITTCRFNPVTTLRAVAFHKNQVNFVPILAHPLIPLKRKDT